MDDISDKGIFVSLWESEADLKASESSGFFQEQMTKLAVVFAALPNLSYLMSVFKAETYNSNDTTYRKRPSDNSHSALGISGRVKAGLQTLVR
jgi:hypothetical protein